MTRRELPRTPGERVDVHRIVQDDALLTRLAHGEQAWPQHGVPAGSSDQPAAMTVEALLADWQGRTVSPELPPPPSAKAVLRAARTAGLSAPARSNSFRAAVGIVASAAFLLSGTAIAGARSAQPGDVLWPVTRTFWADRADATMARHDFDAALGRAAAALAAGDRQGAEQALIAAAAEMPRIPLDSRDAFLMRMQQVGAGVAASPGPAAQAPGPAGTPRALTGPLARPGVPVGPVAVSSPGGGVPADPSGVGGTTEQQENSDDPVPAVAATGPATTGPLGSGATGSGASDSAAPGSGATESDAPGAAATGATGTDTGPADPGSTVGAGTVPPTGTPVSGTATTDPPVGSTTQTPATSSAGVGSTSKQSTGAPTSAPRTSAPSTASPTGSSTASSTASPTVSTTGTPMVPSTAPSTAPSGTTPSTSSTDPISSDAVPTSTTSSRRTTQSAPGFAPPPGTTPGSRTTTTRSTAVSTSSATVAR